MKLLVINGPNINMLGIREVNIYGSENYKTLLERLNNIALEENIELEHFQSNHEGAIVDKIQEAYENFDGIVINPAAYTHTSVAILDALKAVSLPTVEVHISKVSEREDFRQVNFIRDYAIKSFEGLGIAGYEKAILYLKNYLEEEK
ncbi:type II 3-dehydroquinate dehydratase [Peptoniphilus harei]|uniref:3-dehydroquinate dehydratase n=1 Tax=Peptoniphilus harei TaxID=54005 RepID=A0A2X1XYA4_9FIRM|nr:type II 3-dehydroquinate dehydratase [Peptoniphilus harei]MDU5418190.1 type II 3-dehydroquinate dehydratase [Peptoniphilus harei]QQT90889.1 type II 3-dehydroquinate dehydratase [Peptoniphilus harei]SPY48508.1 3-dehydroquinate dehydratase [Peptoniphilus harei]